MPKMSQSLPDKPVKGKLYITNVSTPNNSKTVEVCHGVKLTNAQRVLGNRNIYNIVKAELVIGKPGDFERGKPASDNYEIIPVAIPDKYVPVPRLKKKKKQTIK